jgi:ribosomal protein S18 acetylase RimI-like enzyme
LVLVPREDHAILANVAVHPSATGAGLGRALMDQAELESRKLGLKKLKLSTHVDIPENVHLYEHRCWRETDRASNKVFMEKPLPH